MPSQATWAAFRQRRNQLFLSHPQSALNDAQKAKTSALPYFPYNPAWRFVLPIDFAVESDILEVSLTVDGITRMQRFGKVHIPFEKQTLSLSLFWLLGYGGGVFLPFRDLTSGSETYGGGRYLLDTIKHADLGQTADQLILDFNYAYNPSCAYNDQWHCPLAPPENRLSIPIRAGEKKFPN
ncbi:MAG: DUF1684 domain-containing protein [Chloroflexota bacterium]